LLEGIVRFKGCIVSVASALKEGIIRFMGRYRQECWIVLSGLGR
jgi:hypothetical protein